MSAKSKANTKTKNRKSGGNRASARRQIRALAAKNDFRVSGDGELVDKRTQRRPNKRDLKIAVQFALKVAFTWDEMISRWDDSHSPYVSMIVDALANAADAKNGDGGARRKLGALLKELGDFKIIENQRGFGIEHHIWRDYPGRPDDPGYRAKTLLVMA